MAGTVPLLSAGVIQPLQRHIVRSNCKTSVSVPLLSQAQCLPTYIEVIAPLALKRHTKPSSLGGGEFEEGC